MVKGRLKKISYWILQTSYMDNKFLEKSQKYLMWK